MKCKHIIVKIANIKKTKNIDDGIEYHAMPQVTTQGSPKSFHSRTLQHGLEDDVSPQ